MGLAPYGRPDPALRAFVEEFPRSSRPTASGSIPTASSTAVAATAVSSATRSSTRLGPPRGSPARRSRSATVTSRSRCSSVSRKRRSTSRAWPCAKRGSRNLCVAGGVALNCKMTGVLHRAGHGRSTVRAAAFVRCGVGAGSGDARRPRKPATTAASRWSTFSTAPNTTMPRSRRCCGVIGLSYRRSDDIADDGRRARRRRQRWSAGFRAGWKLARARSAAARSSPIPRQAAMSDTVNDKVKFREPMAAVCALDSRREGGRLPGRSCRCTVHGHGLRGRPRPRGGDRRRPACRRSHHATADGASRRQSALLGADRRLPPPHRRARRAQHLVQRQGGTDRVQPRPMPSAASTEPAWTRWRLAAFCSRNPTPVRETCDRISCMDLVELPDRPVRRHPWEEAASSSSSACSRRESI